MRVLLSNRWVLDTLELQFLRVHRSTILRLVLGASRTYMPALTAALQQRKTRPDSQSNLENVC